MKSVLSTVGMFAVALTIAVLTGCATRQDVQHKQHHPDTTTSQATDAMSSGSGSADDKMRMMDTKAMCDMHQKMMNARTPEERRAMMDERMKGMSPEMRQQHMDMMQEKCR